MSLAALLFNRSDSVDSWTQTNICDTLCHGDRMYLHALTNKMVPDTNSLSINELPEVVTSQNNVEYCLNYSKFNRIVLQIKLVIFPLNFPLSYLHTNRLPTAALAS